jgi:argininosuccinate lyase
MSYLRGLCRHTLGNLVGVAAANLTPSGQIDNRLVAYDELPTAYTEARRGAILLEEVLRSLTVKERRMKAACGPLLSGTDVAELLVVNEGISPKLAHRVIGAYARRAGRDQFDHDGLRKAFQKVVGKPMLLTAAQFAQCVAAENVVLNRATEGGAHPDLVKGMSESFMEAGGRFGAWVDEQKQKTNAACVRLLARARDFVREHRAGES